MQQPSAQGIASLYMGNPQPLQQQIQKDQQAKPGLPPDLQKMLALQIVTNEKDAAAAQTAMQQLKQMSGPTGQMPTVMQTLEQQAQQKMQPPMGMPQQAPEGQAPQGQGIDQLPAQFSMAGGGLVSFDDGGGVPYETRYDRMNRKNRGELTEEERKKRDEMEALLAQIPTGGPTVDGGERVEGSEFGRNVKNTLMALPGASAARALSGSAGAVRGAAAGLAALGDRKEPTEQPPALARSVAPAGPIATSQGPGDQFRPRRPPEPVANDLAALARQKQQAAAPRPPAPPAPPAQATPPAESEAMGILKQQMMAKPEDREAAEIAKYKAAVPAPDTSQHDRLIAELENRKQALNPKQGFEGLMEALSDVSRASQDPRTRGRGSFASGAAGALLGADRAKENQLQQFELSKQAIDVSQKKLEAVRAYAEKTYGVGKAAFDQVYKDRHDAAKEVVKDEAGAARLAKEETLKLLEMKNAKEIAAGHDATTLAAAQARTEGGGDKQRLAELKSLQTLYTGQMKTTYNKADKALLQAKLSSVEAEIAKMAGVGTMPGAPGAGSPGGIPSDVQALLNKYGGK